ncbi:MAG: ParB/RepB/Spo0J family partition protein [Candidatus Binatia bacterium]
MDGTKRTGLGRGFGALIPQAPSPKPLERSLPLDQVGPNPWQPRVDFDDEKLREMAESIREHGVVEPLVVRQRHGSFELVAGERRLRAARLAGLQAVPVVVRDMDDREVLEVTLIENLQREDLSALEEAAAYVRLMEEFGATQEDVARRVGKSRPAVANTIRLLQLPEAVRDAMRSGRLSAGHARALLALESPIEQTALARDVVRLGLSVRQLEARIRWRKQPRASKRPGRDLHVADVEKQLMRSLGTRVRLHARGQRGRIVIEFYSPAELERLLERLRRP